MINQLDLDLSLIIKLFFVAFIVSDQSSNKSNKARETK